MSTNGTKEAMNVSPRGISVQSGRGMIVEASVIVSMALPSHLSKTGGRFIIITAGYGGSGMGKGKRRAVPQVHLGPYSAREQKRRVTSSRNEGTRTRPEEIA